MAIVAAKPAAHPKYSDMVRKAVEALDDRRGTSRAAIQKYIVENFQLIGNNVAIQAHLRQALKRGVETGALKQVKGVGASGSFRIGDKSKKSKAMKSTKVSEKPAAKSPKSVTKSSTKKSAAKPKIEKKAASPKKATSKTPKAKNLASKAVATPKKTATPKKAVAKKTMKKVARKVTQ